MVGISQDDVIEDFDFEKLTGSDKVAGDVNVRLRRSLFSARMIVRNDDCSGAVVGQVGQPRGREHHSDPRLSDGPTRGAERRGLAKDKEVFVVADGSVWIWNVQQDRFGRAQGVLDFYHASQHLWAVARALHPQDEAAARAWVEPLLSQLRHGQENGVLQTLEDLPAWCARQRRAVPPEAQREQDYFRNHREHVHYEAMAARGCPVGSGAMESFCAQMQGRFKRCGQFWSTCGMGDLLALDVACRNLDWDKLWSKN